MSLIANFKCVSDEEIESIPEYPGTLETFLRDKNEAPRDINISERTGKKRKDPVTWLIGFFIMLFCITLLIYPPKVPESTQDKITSVAVYGGLIFLFVGALIVILYKKKNEGDCCVYVPPVPGTKSQIPEDTMDIDKAWHGIHYLLCGSEKNGHGPLNFILAVIGWSETASTAKNRPQGYSPVRKCQRSQTVSKKLMRSNY